MTVSIAPPSRPSQGLRPVGAIGNTIRGSSNLVEGATSTPTASPRFEDQSLIADRNSRSMSTRSSLLLPFLHFGPGRSWSGRFADRRGPPPRWTFSVADGRPVR